MNLRRLEKGMELLRQVPSNDSLGALPQTPGARDILKKRFRLLPQRQKKDVDSDSKAEVQSSQQRVSQRDGFVQLSSSRLGTDANSLLSKSSNTKKDGGDVEQPSPEKNAEGEKQERRDESVPSLDNTTTSASQGNLPHYHSPLLSPAERNVAPAKFGVVRRSHNPASYLNKADPTGATGSNSGTLGDDRSDVTAMPQISPASNSATTIRTPLQRVTGKLSSNEGESLTLQRNDSKLEWIGKSNPPDISQGTTSTSSTGVETQIPASTTSRLLKLFPDPVPIRASSKNAMRSSTNSEKVVGDVQSRIASPKPGMSSLAVVVHSASGPSRESSSSPTVKNRSIPLNRSLSPRLSPSPIPQRPTSLQLGTINGFPLPAPMKPLPAVPEFTRTDQPASKHSSNAPLKARALSPTHYQALGLSPFNGPLLKAAPINGRFPRATADACPRRLRIYDMAEQPVQRITTSQSEQSLLERTRKNRTERVRALRMRDISESRLYLKGSRSPRLASSQSQPNQLSASPETIPEDFDNVKRRKNATEQNGQPEYLQAPNSTSESTSNVTPLSALRRLNRPSIGQHNVSMRDSTLSSLKRQDELTTAPDTPRSYHTFRSSSACSVRVTHGKVLNRLREHPRSQSPSLPSSDDEAIPTATPWRFTDNPRSPQQTQEHGSAIASAFIVSRPGKFASSEDLLHSSRPRSAVHPDSKITSLHSPYFPARDHGFRRVERSHTVLYPDSTIQALEARVGDLERQNKSLQAALMAALGFSVNAGTDSDSLQSVSIAGSNGSGTPPTLSTSVSSLQNSVSADDTAAARGPQREKTYCRADKRLGRKTSSVRDGYDSFIGKNERADVRALESMIEDLELGWASDRSSAKRNSELG